MGARAVYCVRIFPLKLHAFFCRSGSSFVVSITRKGVELASYPTLCINSGEVVFDTGADAKTKKDWRIFQVTFESPKDLRNVSFSIYDFSAGRSPQKIVGFSVALSGMCSVFANEVLNDSKGVAFRFGNKSCRLDTYFCMFPVGVPEPSIRLSGAPSSASGQGSAAEKKKVVKKMSPLVEKTTARLPDSAVRSLHLGGLLPRSFTAVELDMAMAGEIAARAELLFPSRETLEKRLGDLRREVARLEYEEQYGTKDLVREGSHAAAALREEYMFWMKKITEIKEKAAFQAGLAPPPAVGAEDHGKGATFQTYDEIREKEIVKGIEREHEKLSQLDKEQTHRDVTQDAAACLSKIETLEMQLAELKQTLKPAMANKGGTVGNNSFTMEAIKALYKEDEGDCWDKLVAALYAAEAKDVELHQLLLALNRLQVHPYQAGIENGKMHEIPKVMEFVEFNPRDLAKHEDLFGNPTNEAMVMGGGGAAPERTALLDDLFAPAPSASPEDIGSIDPNAQLPFPTTSSMDKTEVPFAASFPPGIPTTEGSPVAPALDAEPGLPPTMAVRSPVWAEPCTAPAVPPVLSTEPAVAEDAVPVEGGPTTAGDLHPPPTVIEVPPSSSVDPLRTSPTADETDVTASGTLDHHRVSSPPLSPATQPAHASTEMGPPLARATAPLTSSSEVLRSSMKNDTAPSRHTSEPMGQAPPVAPLPAPTETPPAHVDPLLAAGPLYPSSMAASASPLSSSIPRAAEVPPTAMVAPSSVAPYPVTAAAPHTVPSLSISTGPVPTAVPPPPPGPAPTAVPPPPPGPAPPSHPTISTSPLKASYPFPGSGWVPPPAAAMSSSAPTAAPAPATSYSSSMGHSTSLPPPAHPTVAPRVSAVPPSSTVVPSEPPAPVGSSSLSGTVTSLSSPSPPSAAPPSTPPSSKEASITSTAAATSAETSTSSSAPIPRGPPPPRYILRPTSLDEIPFARFFTLDILARGCPIDIFLDGVHPSRGTELTLVNNLPKEIIIGGIELKEENMFSSDPNASRVIPTRRWPQKMKISGGGGTDTFVIAMHPTFPRGSSVLAMINLYIWEANRYVPVPGRFTV